jgi:putative DNA-binding protein
MNLLELQRRMVEDVRRPLTEDYEMQRTDTDGYSVEQIAATYIKPNALLTSFERLEIYNRQYWFRVIDAVSEDYPAISAVLGPEKFDAMLLAYLKETPSTSRTLRDLSGKLPEFLNAHPMLAGRERDLAFDVARLEWAYIEAFDGRQLAPLTADDIQSISPDSRVSLQPHIRLLDLHYPVDEIVLAVHKETPESDIVSNAAVERKPRSRREIPSVRKEQIYLAVHRYDNSVYYRRIKREAWRLLRALGRGASIAESITEAFVRTQLTGEEQTALLRETFAHASELGWLCPMQEDDEKISGLPI